MFLTAGFTRWLLGGAVAIGAFALLTGLVGLVVVFAPFLALPAALGATLAFGATIGLAGRLLF